MRALLLGTALVTLFSAAAAAAGPLRIPSVDEVYPYVPSWKGLTVLHVGDSHVSAGLVRRLRRHVRGAGARYRPVCWVGSRARSWVASGRMREEIRKVRPDVVVITLGTNAMRHRNPRRYSAWIAKLVRQVGERTCYWLGPPPLLDDARGFLEMLAGEVKPCRYFDSTVLDAPRRADGKFHLTRSQGEVWADLVWAWMNDRQLERGGEVAGAL